MGLQTALKSFGHEIASWCTTNVRYKLFTALVVLVVVIALSFVVNAIVPSLSVPIMMVFGLVFGYFVPDLYDELVRRGEHNQY